MLSLYLESRIVVRKAFGEIPRFFSDPRSLEAWDRSVARVVPTSEGPLRVGYTFETIGASRAGREGKRSAYRVTKLEPTMNQVELTNSSVFKNAVWTFSFRKISEGTLVVCAVDVTVRPQYFIVALVLRFNRRALLVDLQRLKAAMENRE